MRGESREGWIHMQVGVTFTEVLSQKAEVSRKQTEPESNCIVQPVAGALGVGRGFSSLTESPSPATSFSQPQQISTAASVTLCAGCILALEAGELWL